MSSFAYFLKDSSLELPLNLPVKVITYQLGCNRGFDVRTMEASILSVVSILLHGL
jgi:hypothetical protein